MTDPRQPAYDAVYAYLASVTDVPRDLVTRNAIAWRAVHAALDAVLVPPTVAGRCPACRGESLMLTDGHVTCRRLDCPDPEAADQLLRSAVGNAP